MGEVLNPPVKWGTCIMYTLEGERNIGALGGKKSKSTVVLKVLILVVI